jgi:two-component system invasion response regulator UvrY
VARILVADDHAVARAGYVKFLEFETGVTAVGEASDGEEALARLHEGWDVVLLDIHMPKSNGLDVLQVIRKSYPAIRVLVTSGLPEEQYARNVMRAGASGYLSKASGVGELKRALKLVLAGRYYVSATLAEILRAERTGGTDGALHTRLSNREFQIFCRIAAGGSVSRIATELQINVKTASTYRSRILEKLQFKTNADITSYAFRNNLIS